MNRLFLRLCAAALLAAGTATSALAQGQAPPDWVRRYFASERSGRFAHAWLNKAAKVGTAVAGGPQAGPPGTYDLRGTFRVAVLAGTYSDVTPVVSTASLDTLFFGAGGGPAFSLAQYYSEVSRGRFTVAGTVTPWLRLQGARSAYGRNITPFIRDLLARADSVVDWRQYDNDGPDGVPNSGDDDGFVDLAFLVHPMADGVCRTDATGGPIATGWRVSLSGAFSGRVFTTRVTGANGQKLKVEDFVIAASRHCSGTGVASINITAHELGHALGLPDLYDLDQSSFGVGSWDLMGYGLYLADGRPAYMGAWTRQQLGWISPSRVTANADLVITPAEVSGAAYRIDLPGTNEYLLLENRQRIGSDGALPGTGLLVWHVDDGVLQGTLGNYRANDDDARQGVRILQADGRTDLLSRANLGDPGDPFPGTALNTVISDGTFPSARSNTGGMSNIRLLNVTETATGDILLRVVLSSADPSGNAVMAELLRGNILTAAQRQHLDANGNADGVFNSGDVLAWIARNGPLPAPRGAR